MAATGFWTGMERATGNLANTGMQLLQYQGQQANSATRLKIEQDRADREAKAFKYAEEERQVKEKQLNAFIPLSVAIPNINDLPDSKNTAVKMIADAGHEIKQGADGEIYTTNRGAAYYQDLVKNNLAAHKLALESAHIDLENKNAALTQQIGALQESGGKDEKITPLLEKQKAIKLQMAGLIGGKEDVQKAIAIEQAKVKTPDTVPYKTPEGKIVLINEHDPNSQKIIDEQNLIPATMKTTEGGLTYHIEKEQIGGQKVQDYRVFVDKVGNVTKREAVGKPYTNTEGVANIRVQAFGTTVNPTTGTYFDKIKKKHFMNIPQPDGSTKPVELTSEQVRNLGLQTKEEATASDIKSMQQSAPAVLDFTKKLNKEITDAEKGLGPAASRWREFTQGKVGLSDPAFTEIKTNIELLVTRLMKMHVGARGSEYIMQEFKKMVEVGKTSPKNLKASLRQIEDYANEAGKGRIPKLYENVVGASEGNQQPSVTVIRYDVQGNRVQ